MMSDPRQLAYDFLSALAANDPAQYERGYQIVVIHAEPMSRRVVSRYGFEEFA